MNQFVSFSVIIFCTTYLVYAVPGDISKKKTYALKDVQYAEGYGPLRLALFPLVSENTVGHEMVSVSECQEYAKLVYVEEYSPVLTRRRSRDKVSQCGIVEVPLVIGGIAAKDKEFPHMAVIGYGKSADDPNIAWQCGASLISETYVMSASHCMRDQGGSPVVIRLGDINLEAQDDSQTQLKKVVRMLKHPEFDLRKKYNDISLIEMDSPVTFTAFVRPACLHVEPTTNENRVIATGFGKTSFDSTTGSKILMKVTLDLLPSKNCEQYFKKEISIGGSLDAGITESQLCAGELKGGKDTCQGDSGGPLQVVLADPYCMYSLVGIVSFGKFCGFANQPAIYTNVASYIPWIEGIVWK